MTFRTDPATRAKLGELARAADVTEGEIVRRAVEAYAPPANTGPAGSIEWCETK